jgi:hypothetical protein
VVQVQQVEKKLAAQVVHRDLAQSLLLAAVVAVQTQPLCKVVLVVQEAAALQHLQPITPQELWDKVLLEDSEAQTLLLRDSVAVVAEQMQLVQMLTKLQMWQVTAAMVLHLL